MIDQENIHTIKRIPKELLSLKLTHLRTFLMVLHTKSFNRAATELGINDLTTIERHVDAVQARIEALTGEPALHLPGVRGIGTRPTHSGLLLQAYAEGTVLQLIGLTRALQRPRPLLIGLTSYMMQHRFVRHILRDASRKFRRDKLPVRFVFSQVASDDIQRKLTSHLLDFAFGGLTLEPDGKTLKLEPGIGAMEFHKEKVGLLATYKLPRKISAEVLRQQSDHLIAPTHGIFLKALNRLLAPQEVEQLIATQTADAPVAVDSLTLAPQPTCIFGTDQLARTVLKGTWHKRFRPLDPTVLISAGVFFRTDNAATSNHPKRSAQTRSYPDPVYEAFRAVVAKQYARRTKAKEGPK